MFHDKTHRRSGLSATEALVYAFGWGNIERRCLFIMERTACGKIRTPPLEGHEITYDIGNLGRIENPVNCLVRNHLLLLVNLFVIDVFHITHKIIPGIITGVIGTCLMDFILVNGLFHLP